MSHNLFEEIIIYKPNYNTSALQSLQYVGTANCQRTSITRIQRRQNHLFSILPTLFE